MAEPIDRAKILAFLRAGLAKMSSDDLRQSVADDRENVPRPGPKLCELQREEWDVLGIDRDKGCEALDSIDGDIYANDAEVVRARDDFVQSAMNTYLNVIERRKPAVLERVKPMPKEIIMEFFDACNTKMGTVDFQLQLKKEFDRTGQMPNQMIVDAQRDMLEVLGFERDHGCECLSKQMDQNYRDDKQMVGKFKQWQQTAQRTCMALMGKGAGKCNQKGAVGHQHSAAQMQVAKELQDVMPDAKTQLIEMSPEDRGIFLTEMQPKLQEFMALSLDDKVSFIKTMPKADKIEFSKAQLLVASLARDQMAAKGKGGPAPQEMMMSSGKGGKGGGYSSAPVTKPQQQMMM